MRIDRVDPRVGSSQVGSSQFWQVAFDPVFNKYNLFQRQIICLITAGQLKVFVIDNGSARVQLSVGQVGSGQEKWNRVKLCFILQWTKIVNGLKILMHVKCCELATALNSRQACNLLGKYMFYLRQEAEVRVRCMKAIRCSKVPHFYIVSFNSVGSYTTV